jgi:hypothetical protein
LRHNQYVRVTVLAALALLVHASAEAQSRFHLGAALTGATEPSSTAADRQDRPGGTTWSGSALLGVRIRRGVFLELEPGMVGDRTDEYTYAAFRDADARVEWKRKEAFLTGQLRWKARALEPVAGVRYIHTTTSYHATFIPSGSTYWDARYADHDVALVAGSDAAIRIARRCDVVPTFRLIIRPTTNAHGAADAGTIGLGYGAGIRIPF